MTETDFVAEALECGFEMRSGVLSRPSGHERVVLFVGASLTATEIAAGGQAGGWAIRDAREPMRSGSWAELNRVATDLPTFSIKDRASWAVWGAGKSRQLQDVRFARRFQLVSCSSVAVFTDQVRAALMEIPRCAGFQFLVTRGAVRKQPPFWMIANWPLRRAPRGVLKAAAHALDLVASADMQA